MLNIKDNYVVYNFPKLNLTSFNKNVGQVWTQPVGVVSHRLHSSTLIRPWSHGIHVGLPSVRGTSLRFLLSQQFGSPGCWVRGLCLGSASWWPQGPRPSSLRRGHVRCLRQLTTTRRTVSLADQHPPWPRPSNTLGTILHLVCVCVSTVHTDPLMLPAGRRRLSTSMRSSSVSTASVWTSWWSWLDSAVPRPSPGWDVHLGSYLEF